MQKSERKNVYKRQVLVSFTDLNVPRHEIRHIIDWISFWQLGEQVLEVVVGINVIGTTCHH